LTSARKSDPGGLALARRKALARTLQFRVDGKKLTTHVVVIQPGNNAAWEEICVNGEAAHGVLRNMTSAEAARVAEASEAAKKVARSAASAALPS
jgi:hypothetical protein